MIGLPYVLIWKVICMNKKRILYAILSVLLVPVIFLGLSIFWDFLSERAVEPEVINVCPPCICWDGKLYQAGIELDEEDVIQDSLGIITEIVHQTEIPEKNGQSNTIEIPVGTEIHPTHMGNDLAAYVDGKWIYLRYVPE